jgi:hypothetical protein
MLKRTSTASSLLAIVTSMLVGCRAGPAPSVGFADPNKLKPDPTIPFNSFWRKPGVNWNNYYTIYVADVNTAYMIKQTDWQKGERQADIEKDVQTVAGYARDTIKKTLRDDPKHRLEVVDAPTKDPHGLVLEVALIEVVPSKVALNALGYAPFFIGTGISVARTIGNDKSSAAFEARVRDASTGEIIMLAADHEDEQFAPVDLRGLTWYSDVDGMIDEWAKQVVMIANSKPGEKVEGTATFRLLPW